mmetsp:Transcript_13841/g.21595  ORF Transcript_13841/g.21595 Transcript_13841/m.21595 type:complete len:105 (-) Transcript_13841:745-1059(-)
MTQCRSKYSIANSFSAATSQLAVNTRFASYVVGKYINFPADSFVVVQTLDQMPWYPLLAMGCTHHRTQNSASGHIFPACVRIRQKGLLWAISILVCKMKHRREG